jgi:hypothetical protein
MHKTPVCDEIFPSDEIFPRIQDGAIEIAATQTKPAFAGSIMNRKKNWMHKTPVCDEIFPSPRRRTLLV